jgi:cell division protein FtsB
MPEMLGVRRKYRMRRFFGSKIAFAVVLLLTIVLAQAAIGMYYKAKETRVKKDLVQAELARLQARETELRAENARLSSERGIESELRNRFFIVKDGEKVAVISDNAEHSDTKPASKKEQGFWTKIISAVVFWGNKK